ncbi:hypothetical protein B0J14DRAFT_153628 [Halenospora varia]|nr:hypothetical protein B0J14DRAFT_153628 [Halenospora varia]
MLESPTESSKESSQNRSTPKIRPRNVTSISSAPHTPLDKNPPRQDSSYFSNRSDSSVVEADIQIRQLRARERVAVRRGRVSRTRRLIKGRREELRRLREDLRDASDKFTQKANEIIALGGIQEDLTPYHNRLREAQDTLGPVEDTYDRLESRLDDEEQDLEQEETHFYRHYDVTITSIPDSKLDDPISPLVKSYDAPDLEVEERPLEEGQVQQYMNRVAEASRLKDELDGLEEEYFRISTDASFRNRYDIPLSAETTRFLDEYRTTHSAILEHLHSVENHLFDLRDQCLDQGLFRDSEHMYEPRDALCEDVMETVYEAEDRSPLRMAALRMGLGGEETHFDNKCGYVNNWLFEWIKDSPYECLSLKTWIVCEYPKSPDRGEDLSDDKWSDLALENWNTDGAGAHTNEFYDASMLDAIAGDTGRFNATIIGRSGVSDSLRSLDVDLDDIGRIEEVVLGSEAESLTTPTSNKRRSMSLPLPSKESPSDGPHSSE